MLLPLKYSILKCDFFGLEETYSYSYFYFIFQIKPTTLFDLLEDLSHGKKNLDLIKHFDEQKKLEKLRLSISLFNTLGSQ